METCQNYQLYRTNVLLGGQMKYDLIVNRCEGDLVVSDFHITPISKACPFNVHVQDNLLKYTHQENISRYYKQISSSFYNDFVSDSIYPSAITDDVVVNHDTTYEMGCSRKNYKIYNKQFEFLCPIWIEHISPDEYLDFQFDIYTSDGKTSLISRNLILTNINATNINDNNYHNSFVQYLNNYFDYVGIRAGNPDVMNIQPSKNFASISGVNVENGLKQTKILPNLIKNMFNREIPLMEYDHLLIRNFEDNKLVTSQLFNFNICFNLEDIISSYLYNMMIGSNIKISLSIGIRNNSNNEVKIIGCRDLYTNYEFIPKKLYNIPTHGYITNEYAFGRVDDLTDNTANVLDYMKDYSNISYIPKNKLSSNIIHWSLVGNNDYICNAYNGFSGYYAEEVGGKITYHKTSHLYDNTANILLKNSILSNNSLGWCNMIKLNNKQFLSLSVLSSGESYFKKLCSQFNITSESWVNNIKYNRILTDTNSIDSIKMLFIESQDNIMGSFGKSYTILSEDGFTICEYPATVSEEDFIILFTNDLDRLTYLGTIEVFKQIIESNKTKNSQIKLDKYKYMYDFLTKNKNLDGIEVISSPMSLDIHRADSPSQQSIETEYYKNDKKRGEYVMRYFGKIKPTFVSLDDDINFNYRYYKLNLNNNGSTNIADYKKFQETGYAPTFPSIGYFYIKGIQEKYENTIDPLTKVNIHIKGDEYKDFNNNYIRAILSSLNIDLMNDCEEVTKNEIIDQLRKIYKIPISSNDDNVDQKILEYIYSLYYIKCTFIGVMDGKYNHKIELTLK